MWMLAMLTTVVALAGCGHEARKPGAPPAEETGAGTFAIPADPAALCRLIPYPPLHDRLGAPGDEATAENTGRDPSVANGVRCKQQLTGPETGT